jgi:hypothetical protein
MGGIQGRVRASPCMVQCARQCAHEMSDPLNASRPPTSATIRCAGSGAVHRSRPYRGLALPSAVQSRGRAIAWPQAHGIWPLPGPEPRHPGRSRQNKRHRTRTGSRVESYSSSQLRASSFRFPQIANRTPKIGNSRSLTAGTRSESTRWSAFPRDGISRQDADPWSVAHSRSCPRLPARPRPFRRRCTYRPIPGCA